MNFSPEGPRNPPYEVCFRQKVPYVDFFSPLPLPGLPICGLRTVRLLEVVQIILEPYSKSQALWSQQESFDIDQRHVHILQWKGAKGEGGKPLGDPDIQERV